MINLDDTTGNARLLFLANEEARLQQLLKSVTLQGVTVTTKIKSPMQKLDEKYASGMFQSGDSYQFDLSNDPLSNTYQSVFTYLQGKVAGLQITANGSGTSLNWRGGAPSVYLDESPADVSQLSSMNVGDIAYVKVFRPPFMGGFNGANGAIAVYTKKGGDVQKPAGKGMPYKSVIGYTVMKKFIRLIMVRLMLATKRRMCAVRSIGTPMILTTSENHKIHLSFYNNDVTDAFRVIIEGVTKDGRLTHMEKVIE